MCMLSHKKYSTVHICEFAFPSVSLIRVYKCNKQGKRCINLVFQYCCSIIICSYKQICYLKLHQWECQQRIFILCSTDVIICCETSYFWMVKYYLNQRYISLYVQKSKKCIQKLMYLKTIRADIMDLICLISFPRKPSY